MQPSISKFKKLDARVLLERGEEPFPKIREAADRLKEGEGLRVHAPFLPSPLIEKLGGEGFSSRVERVQGGEWIVYFWKENG